MTVFSRPHVPLSGFIVPLVVLSIGHCLFATELHVSPAGNDANPGSRDRPVATLGAARDLVRASIANGMKEDITVRVEAGDYYVETPIVFDDRDSGRDGHAITYQALPDWERASTEAGESPAGRCWRMARPKHGFRTCKSILPCMKTAMPPTAGCFMCSTASRPGIGGGKGLASSTIRAVFRSRNR